MQSLTRREGFGNQIYRKEGRPRSENRCGKLFTLVWNWARIWPRIRRSNWGREDLWKNAHGLLWPFWTIQLLKQRCNQDLLTITYFRFRLKYESFQVFNIKAETPATSWLRIIQREIKEGESPARLLEWEPETDWSLGWKKDPQKIH